MIKNDENKEKRVIFIESDAALLVELVKKHANVLQNSKTNAITPKMKSEVRNNVMTINAKL